MTVHDCINEYKILGDKIFGHPRPFSWFGVLWPKYSSDSLKRAVNEATGRHSNAGHRLNFEIEAHLAQWYAYYKACRLTLTTELTLPSMVVAYPDSNARGDVPYLFRTYEPPPWARDDVYEKFRSDPRHHPSAIPLHKVARATAAAPAYFRPVRILPAHRGTPLPALSFKDGGFGCNNPSEEAYHDVVEAHGGLSRNIGLFISIGTGVGKFRLFSNKKGHFWDFCANAMAALKRPTLTTLADKSMSHLANFDKAKRFPYFRFDGGEVLGEIAMDEWKSHKSNPYRLRCPGKQKQQQQPGAKTLQTIERAVEAYLEQKSVQRDLKDCAKSLVQRRRLRSAGDPARWERYATSSYYVCREGACDKARFNTSRDFGQHLESVHGVERGGELDMDMDKKVEEGRHFWWLYPS